MADPMGVTVAVIPASELTSEITPPASSPRQVFGGRYEILGLLGAGGMGNVYKARDLELEELVALKVLRPELASAPGALERFRREVKLARRVTHNNVARVFDIGEQGGEKFLSMELVDGESLGALVAREGRLSPARAIEVVSGICAGLGAAHAAGVIHRDLKPDNVLLAPDGRVVVTDFGIARAAAMNDANTATSFLGTPAYMAPEQLEAGATVDARADIYSLGAMLFEILTGERPWRGDTIFALAAARLLNPPPDPRSLRPDVPAGLAALVTRCMARSPDDRYASTAAVAGELAALTLPAIPALPTPSRSSPADAARSSGGKRVAVLPFRNAGEPEHDYLADGLTEELIDLLSMVRGIRVRSRGVVMRYKATDRDPREVGRELDVQVVVEGTVRRAGGVVRISARLISVADGVQLWARRFDRPAGELLAVSDDTAQAIAEALTVEMGAPVRRAPEDPAAIDLYFQARAAYHSFFSARPKSALELFEQALALAPDEPRILAGYAMAVVRRLSAHPERRRAASEAAERAARIAPELPEPQVALAAVRYHSADEAGAIRPLRRALRISSVCAEGQDLLGRILADTHSTEAARRHLEAAIALEPSMDVTRLSILRIHALTGDWERVAGMLEDGAPGAATMRVPAWGRLLLWRPDPQAKAEEMLRLEATSNRPESRIARAMLELAAHGTPPWEVFPDEGSQVSATPRMRGFFGQLEAECACWLGHTERALDALERADRSGFFDVFWMDRCPVLASIRDEPRYLAVHSRVAERAARVVNEYLGSDP